MTRNYSLSSAAMHAVAMLAESEHVYANDMSEVYFPS